jgi:phage shock protein PspC (stress-responsive transcriptional regulator)
MTEDSADTPGSPQRLLRSQDGRLITGVCAGLARHTRIDAIVFRVAFALLVITTGIGILLYALAFVLMGAPDGGPSWIERRGKRLFDGDTALALLGAALGLGTLLGVANNWGSGDALSVIVIFGLALLVAHSRGVDLAQTARTLPERIKGRPLSSWTPPPPAEPAYRTPEGMVDLARLGRRTDTLTDGPYVAPPAEPVDPAPPVAPPEVRHGSPFLTFLTLLIAALVAALLYALFGDRPNLRGVQIVIAGALIVVAAGVLLGAWFGRVRKLVLVGAIMSLALASTSIAGNAAIARRTHHMAWRPTLTTQAEQNHKVLLGQGVVDLTNVPLSPGQRLNVNAEVTLGVLAVKVPSTARVEVDGHAFLGDITVDRQVTSGPGARVHRVLDPEGQSPAPPATIVLRIRSKVGDMEVTRVPA